MGEETEDLVARLGVGDSRADALVVVASTVLCALVVFMPDLCEIVYW